MFMNEIAGKCPVALFDNGMKLLVRGVITGYKPSPATIVIDHRIYYPVNQVAKITLLQQDESPYEHISAHRRI